MDTRALGERIVILGNSGSGKTHLARRLGQELGVALIHLDDLFWARGGYNHKRPAEEVQQDISNRVQARTWIVEGVFGDLAQGFLPRAQSLIWLDLDWETCSRSLLERGSESARWLEPELAEQSFNALCTWAGEYWTRTGTRSHEGHAAIFGEFPGLRLRFERRSDVDRFMAGWPGIPTEHPPAREPI